MPHATEGALRRLLDEPAGVSDADRRHVLDCPTCLAGLASAEADAALVGATLHQAAAAPDVDAAWRRLQTSAARPVRAPQPERPDRVRALLRRPAAAVLAVGLVLAGAGTAAANDWVTVFRTEKVAPLSITAQDLVALPDLSAYGDLEVAGQPDVHTERTAAGAAAQSGLDVPQVRALPKGVTGEPVYQVGNKLEATFTFSASRAAAAAGKALPPLPVGLDGARVRLDAGPGVAEVWTSTSGAPAMVVGRAVAPTASSSGVPFEVVRDYLLSLPGLPDRLAEQLRTYTADGSTLPLPVPADQATTRSEDVDGTAATVLESRDHLLAAVVWVRDGLVTVVAGALDARELLDVARGLR